MTTIIIVPIAIALLGDPIPSMDNVCWSVTNYWPFDTAGNLVAGNGQTDSDPHHTANMTLITGPEQAGQWVAAPFDLVGESVYLPGWGELPVNDTFGNLTYQNGVFWRDGYSQYVIGVDVFTSEPLHYLECDGEVIR